MHKPRGAGKSRLSFTLSTSNSSPLCTHAAVIARSRMDQIPQIHSALPRRTRRGIARNKSCLAVPLLLRSRRSHQLNSTQLIIMNINSTHFKPSGVHFSSREFTSLRLVTATAYFNSLFRITSLPLSSLLTTAADTCRRINRLRPVHCAVLPL